MNTYVYIQKVKVYQDNVQKDTSIDGKVKRQILVAVSFNFTLTMFCTSSICHEGQKGKKANSVSKLRRQTF